MKQDVAERLTAIITRIKAAAEVCDGQKIESVGGDLQQVAADLSDLWVDTVLTAGAVEPVFSPQTGIGRSGEISVMDLCYNAFMTGRNGTPSDPEHARCDWTNDTFPLMRAGVERMKKETLRRMEYARADHARRNTIERERNKEN